MAGSRNNSVRKISLVSQQTGIPTSKIQASKIQTTDGEIKPVGLSNPISNLNAMVTNCAGEQMGNRVGISPLCDSNADQSLAGQSCAEKSCSSDAGQVHDLVQDVVSDLDSLLRFIINMRFGLDGTLPCSHEEIASQLNRNLKVCLREKIEDLLGSSCARGISPDQIRQLEAKAERALCRRRISQ